MTSHIDSDTGTNANMTHSATLQTLAASGDQPGWRVLDTARAQQFTGEITFQVQPSISVYFDSGVAYHAVRAGDPSLCDQLINGGVLEPAQVERGVIRVGNVENLGRLFDRDPSIDRDAVMVVLELATDDVVTSIANTVSGPFTLTAYRHHVSGVHRWFVSPDGSNDHPAQLTPVGEVAQIDGSVTGDLPGLSSVPDDEAVQIEWNEPLAHESEAVTPIHTVDDDLLAQLLRGADKSAPTGQPDETLEAVEAVEAVSTTVAAETAPVVDLTPPIDLVAPVDTTAVVDEAPEPDFSVASEPTAVVDSPPTLNAEPVVDDVQTPKVIETVEPDNAVAPSTEPDGDTESSASADDFQILWPDGSEQHLTNVAADASVVDEAPGADPVAALSSAPVDETDTETFVQADADADADIETSTDAGGPEFAAPIEPLMSIEDLALAAAAAADGPAAPQAIQPDIESEIIETPISETANEPAPTGIIAADSVVDDEPTSLTFDMPSLTVDANNVPDDEQPEEVVEAVRRALEAIEAASAAPTELPHVAVGSLPAFEPTAPLEFDVVDPLAQDASTISTSAVESESTLQTPSVSALESVLPPAEEVIAEPAPDSAVAASSAPAAAVTDPAPTGLGSFAPPTLQDSAEAVYARAAAEQTPAGPAAGVASVVFVDETPEESDDRSGALKRLIGSLRRK